jgi:hypothetical protein
MKYFKPFKWHHHSHNALLVQQSITAIETAILRRHDGDVPKANAHLVRLGVPCAIPLTDGAVKGVDGAWYRVGAVDTYDRDDYEEHDYYKHVCPHCKSDLYREGDELDSISPTWPRGISDEHEVGNYIKCHECEVWARRAWMPCGRYDVPDGFAMQDDYDTWHAWIDDWLYRPLVQAAKELDDRWLDIIKEKSRGRGSYAEFTNEWLAPKRTTNTGTKEDVLARTYNRTLTGLLRYADRAILSVNEWGYPEFFVDTGEGDYTLHIAQYSQQDDEGVCPVPAPMSEVALAWGNIVEDLNDSWMGQFSGGYNLLDPSNVTQLHSALVEGLPSDAQDAVEAWLTVFKTTRDSTNREQWTRPETWYVCNLILETLVSTYNESYAH